MSNDNYTPLSSFEQQDKDSNFSGFDSDFPLENYGIGVEEIRVELEAANSNTGNESKGLFTVKPANRWIEQAMKRPIPKMLFGEFWFEGELCILFADTNLGKSALAVQICNSISSGEPIRAFMLEAERQKVLYYDFELSDKQFEARYSEQFQNHYAFNSNFLRAEVNPEKADFREHGFDSFERYLYDSLEKSIAESESKILCIDNITYLKDTTEQAKFALPLMKDLQGLKKKYNLSILALAHTPKRDLTKPITRNDLQGSKMLINFCDSSFAIGESSTDKGIRYLKQVKARNTEIIYDTENVCVCQVSKPDNFLKFDFLNYGSEREHLKNLDEADKQQRISDVLELKSQGVSNIEIGRRLGVSEGAIRKMIKKANENQHS